MQGRKANGRTGVREEWNCEAVATYSEVKMELKHQMH